MSTSNELPSLSKLQLPPIGLSDLTQRPASATTSGPQLPSLNAYRFPPKNDHSPERTRPHGLSEGHSLPPTSAHDAYPGYRNPPLGKAEEDAEGALYSLYRRHSIAGAARGPEASSPLARELDPNSRTLPPPHPNHGAANGPPPHHDIRPSGPNLPPIPEFNSSPGKRKEPNSPHDSMRPEAELKRRESHNDFYPPPHGNPNGPRPTLPLPRNRLFPPGSPGAFDPQARRFSLPAASMGMSRPGGPGLGVNRGHLPPPPPPPPGHRPPGPGYPPSQRPGPPPNMPDFPPPSGRFGPPPLHPPSASSATGPHDPSPYPAGFNMARRASMPVIAHENMKAGGDPYFRPPGGHPDGGAYGGYPHPSSYPMGLNGHGYLAQREIAKGETPYSRSPELRVSHKLAERKRRREMKDLFDELRDQLPLDKSLKTSKWEILSKAIVFISDLKDSEKAHREEAESLRNQLAVLKQGRRSST
ncbi:hypothetical protein H4R35_005447 [Dimargaris xerosporica]|nr:hypothetical protein H4R35_005447 [Dimargaris xerosporica]